MGSLFVGVIAYADDIILICLTTKKSMDILTGICEVYTDEFNTTFNAKKSIFLVFKGRECVEANTSICMCVNGDNIKKSESADHLGHRISKNVKSAIASFWMYFNMVLCDFGHTCSFVKRKLFNMYCCSFYGVLLWFLYGSAVRELCVAWLNTLRKVWNVPPQTLNKTITLLSESVPLDI